ncbi:chemotaxis protein CheW [Lederbergia sp. NSJ-179]|uniref:chemotaxis protein CheW n=1 Tax=Lederbergia sp. NSJ-179 TaxID=2931402 RepID=UPI001FD60C42|nr:chemotaxis protein CheW [Lederbergia sp. NSJ-179]MCJ7839661.1 chemotaxis protein CheW [Lederbergia sp. NSJ-179]
MSKTVMASEKKVVVFTLNQKEYCISAEYVTAIEKMHPITRVPNMPPFIKGVINLRGIIIPIIDLKKRFNMGDSEYLNSTRIIIVTWDEMTVGMIVDEANDVLDIPAGMIEPCPNVAGSVAEEYISGVANMDHRLFILLDLEKTMKPPELRKINNGY